MIYGSQEFVADLKARFLEDKKDAELPQHNSPFREFDPELLLTQASKILGFNFEAARHAEKIGLGEKDHRDLLIYLLWKTGRLSNMEWYELNKDKLLENWELCQKKEMPNPINPLE